MELWHCLTEKNEWEGETWYHYFIDGEGVYEALRSAVKAADDLTLEESQEISWETATRLTNLDDAGYMQTHWFGELTDFEGLSAAKDLYKGKIRDFGEELFERERGEYAKTSE